MCATAAAVAIGQFVLSAASAVMSYQGQQAQFEAQQEYYKNNRDAANKAAVNQYASQQNRALQEREAASQEKQKLNVEAAKGRATAAVAANEAGVAGLSVDALIADYYGQEGRYERTIDNNLQMRADYLTGEMEAVRANAEGRINSVEQGTPPSFGDAAIRILGAGLDAFGSFRQNKSRLN